MAKALHSARKTPFQNLGDCSAIKLKGAPAAVFGPTWGKSGVDGQGGGVRRSRPKVGIVYFHLFFLKTYLKYQ